MSKIFIAIDGGGTSTEGVAVDRVGVLAYRTDAASNPHDIGEDAAISLVCKMAAELVSEARAKTDADEVYLFAGISGVIGREERFESALRAAVGGTVSVKSDIYNLFGLVERDNCAALICGTGSVCFIKKDGELHRVGGWGYLLDGAEGGGFAIGRAGLLAALRSRDGRIGKTTLLDAARRYLECDVTEAIAKVYAGGKTYIAGFAPYVIEEAEKGDAEARALISGSVLGVSEMLSCAAEKLGDGFDCILSGGLIRYSGLGEMIAAATSHLNANFITPSLPQIAGGIRRAFALGGESITQAELEAYINNIRK